MNQNTVFISYRRDLVGKSFARQIERELLHRYYDVFLDVDCLGAGRWEDQIIAQIQDRAHFLLLLTPAHWIVVLMKMTGYGENFYWQRNTDEISCRFWKNL